MANNLTDKQRLWVEEYLICWNAGKAAEIVYKSSTKEVARQIGSDNLHNPVIRAIIEERMTERAMSANEVLARLSEHARADLTDFLTPTGRGTRIDIKKGVNAGKGHLLKKYTTGKRGTSVEIVDQQSALIALGRRWKLFGEADESKGQASDKKLVLPADVIAPPFVKVYRDIRDHRHTEYLFFGGRGSTKSSFISLVMIYLLVNNPGIHAVAMRQIANTLRDSVYAQLIWAITELGLIDQFDCTTSPMEIVYKSTGQTIYFRGADKPEAIKSIKPPFGYIGLLWFEELDQFHGEESIRKVEQSVIRGGDLAYIFKSFNPPRTANNWANKYAKIPKATQYQHSSNYLDVPPEWLGKVFLEEADHLKTVNPKAYEHEYMGEANGTGGLVFENLQLRPITDAEIAQFDHHLMGNDWGYYPDPFAWVKCHYDAARLTLYIFDELRMLKAGNKETFEALIYQKDVGPEDSLISDSAEPKSVADYRQYSADGVPALDKDGNPVLDEHKKPVMLFGPSCRGAEKGPDSIKYSIKWFQSLVAIVIDNERCPFAAEEFLNYEYEQDKDGNFISEYPDRDNHFIDAGRYATNLVWRRRGN